MVIRFDSFEIDETRGVLRKAGTAVRLRNQSLLVLAALLRRAGQVVTAGELRRVVWGDHTFVDFEQGLRSCVKEIRAVLGDNANDPAYVKTLPRIGYRFVGAVEAIEPAGVGAEPISQRRHGAQLPEYASSDEPPASVPA
jgi:DNA-binding winged helix-turn-helix (wHTH) protein